MPFSLTSAEQRESDAQPNALVISGTVFCGDVLRFRAVAGVGKPKGVAWEGAIGYDLRALAL